MWNPSISRSMKDGDELLMVDQLCEKEENGRDEPEKEAVLNRMVIEQLMELLDERGTESHPVPLF